MSILQGFEAASDEGLGLGEGFLTPRFTKDARGKDHCLLGVTLAVSCVLEELSEGEEEVCLNCRWEILEWDAAVSHTVVQALSVCVIFDSAVEIFAVVVVDDVSKDLHHLAV